MRIHNTWLGLAGNAGQVRSRSEFGVDVPAKRAVRPRLGGAAGRRADALGRTDSDGRGRREKVVPAAPVEDSQITGGERVLAGRNAVDIAQ